MAAFLNTCRFTAAAGGTSDFVVSSAVTGYKTPATASAVNGRVYKWRAENASLSEWEEFEGAYTSGTTTVARTTVLASSTGAKVNFSAAPQVFCVGLKEDLISVEESNSFTATQTNQLQKNAGIPAILRSYLAGLTLSTAGSSTTFSVAAGVATDSTNADVMTLGSSISKTTSAWAVGTGSGGLDTGSIAASTWYHIYLIKRPDTGVVDILISLSATAPTLPTNYTLFRRIGSLKTDSSSQWVLFIQNGDEFMWMTPFSDVNTTTLGTTPLLVALSVPTGLKINALFRVGFSHATATTMGLINSPDETATTPYTPAGNASVLAPVNNGSYFAVFNLRTDTSGRIRAVSQSSNSSLAIATYGWIDIRGRV